MSYRNQWLLCGNKIINNCDILKKRTLFTRTFSEIDVLGLYLKVQQICVKLCLETVSIVDLITRASLRNLIIFQKELPP